MKKLWILFIVLITVMLSGCDIFQKKEVLPDPDDITDTGYPVSALFVEGKQVDSSWVVAYDDNGGVMKRAATELTKYLHQTIGIKLNMVKGAPEAGVKAFYIKDERVNDNKESYAYYTDKNGVTIKGSHERGAIYGVYDFLEDQIGWRFVAIDAEECNETKLLNLTGINKEFTPYFIYRDLYISESYNDIFCVKRQINGNEKKTMHESLGGTEALHWGLHTLGTFAEQDYSHGEPANPCVYDSNVYYKVLKNLKKVLEQHPTGTISVSQNDTNARCQCERCKAGEEYYESSAGPLLAFVNRLARAIKKEYPEAHLEFLAYQYTRKCPKNIVCEDNVVVYIAPIDACQNHTYDDPDCYVNAGIKNDIVEWSKICSRIQMFDYSTDFLEHLCPFPNVYNICSNMRFMVENNVKCYLNMGLGRWMFSSSPEFSAMRVYLFSKCMEDPYMTEEEFHTCIEDFCRIYYGAGYEYILKYLDFCERLADEKDGHFSAQYFVEGIYGQHPFTPYNDQLVEWFDKAEEMAETELQLEHVQRLRISCDYIRLGSIFLDYYDAKEGTDEEKAAKREYIVEQNKKLYEMMKKYNIVEIRDGIFTPGFNEGTRQFDDVTETINFEENIRLWNYFNGYDETNSPEAHHTIIR